MRQGQTYKTLFSRFAIITLLVSLVSTISFAQNANYPFPQNYQYSYGEIYKGSDVQSKIQGLYTAWLSKYYVEGTMGGTPVARIKFQQPSGTDADGHATVSEGIAYGMLVMVYMDNATNKTKDKFDRLWAYYKKNVDGDGVMNWKVNAFTGNVEGGTYNAHGATDAEIDVAQALLMAHKQWGDAKYLNDAKDLITIIWNRETFTYSGKRYLKPGNMFEDYLNPCYFITNALQLFEDPAVNPGNNWSNLVQNSYDITKVCRNNTTGLVPDWCYPNGTLLSGIINDKFESYFLYDAIRVPWRMAQAYAWYGHADAKEIAKKMTDWAITKFSGNPANAKDGYNLDGSAFTSSHANFKELGKYSNPCFTGGFGVGAMVDNTPAYKDFLNAAWVETSKNDPYGAYYTHTTQLLYLLVMTGNMPNFWDMKPVARTAETNANGNQIIIEFSKAINASSASTAGWAVKTFESELDATATNISVTQVAVDPANNKKVILTLASDIEEFLIYVNYNGTALAGTDASKVDNITDLEVQNKITNMQPAPINRFTDIIGTTVKVQWSKDIAPASVDASKFSVTVNGVSKSIISASVDDDDATILNLLLEPGSITSSSNEVTLSFAGGAITGTTSSKTAVAFTNAPVQNFYMSVTCTVIDDFNPSKVSWTTWGTATWDGAATDPAGGSKKVGKFVADKNDADINVKGPLSNVAEFNNALAGGSTMLKFRLYVSNLTAGEKIRIRLYAEPNPATPNYWGDHIIFEFTPTSLNAWHDYEFDVKGQYSPSLEYNWILLQASPDKTGSETVYIDDIKVCPAPPVVDVVNGKVNFDGTQVELRFSTAMKVPANPSEIIIYEDGLQKSVSKVESKQGDASILVVTLADAISSETATVYVGGGGSSALSSLDGRPSEMFYKEIVNLYGITVTTGWRDDFDDLTDYVTANIGTGTAFAGEETATGTYKITGTGKEDWDPVVITTYGSGTNDSKQVMDLTGREIVQIKYRVPSATSTKLYLRIDVTDKVTGTGSDNFAFVELPFTAGSNTWQEKTFALQFYSQYGTPSGDVDRTNIKQVSFHFIEKEGTAANNYLPTNFKGVIEFDYISVGSALILSNVPASVNQGSPITTATSSADGTIFLVPGNTPPILSALQDSVFAGKGVSVAATANTAATLQTSTLTAGYYEAYAYDPIAGAISAKVGIDLIDVTPPIITQFDSGEFGITSTVSATVNEDALLYILPKSVTDYSHASLLSNSVYSISVSEDVMTTFGIELFMPKAQVGDEYKFIAADYSYPSPNISEPTASFKVIDAPLSMMVTPVGDISQGDEITVTSSREATAYLVPNTVLISTVADLTTHSVSQVATTVLPAILSTDVDEGEYYVYVSDGTDIVGPSEKIIIEVSSVPVTGLELLQSTLTLNAGESKSTEIVFTPTNASDKTLDITFDNTYVSVDYNAATGLVQVTGVKATESATQITLTSPDGPIETLSVTVNQLPESIVLAPETKSLALGETVQLQATVLPADVTNPALTWESSNPAVASVSPTGLVTAETLGTPVTITAKSVADPSVIATAIITVSATPVTAITLDIEDVVISLGATQQIVAEVTPANATNSTLIWSSADETVAKVSQTGLISSIGIGTTTITVSSQSNPELSKTITVEVKDVEVEDITINEQITSLEVGKTTILTASVVPVTAPQTVTWASSDETVATVSASGLVTAKVPGSVTITATASGGKSDAITIVITPKLVESITITPSTLNLKVNDESQLVVTVLPADASDKTYTWVSLDPSVATISEAGDVTALKPGTTTITATANDASGKSASVSVVVSANLVTGVSVSPSVKSVEEGGTALFTASVIPISAANKVVNWSSSDESIATIDAEGNVTTLKVGEVIITATATDGSNKFGTATLNVTPKLVTGITISPSSLILNLGGESKSLSASVVPATATDRSFTWSSSDGSIATVDAAGEVTAVSLGTTTIIATANDASGIVATATVEVKPTLPTSITVAPAIGFVVGGASQTPSYTISPSYTTDKTVTWESSNPAVATVDATTGEIIPVAEGESIITVTSVADPTVTATITVTVASDVVDVQSVALNKQALTLKINKSETLLATISPETATNKSVTWSSSNPAVATVSNGLVEAKSVGTTTITVTTVDGSFIDECVVTVENQEVTSITITPNVLTLQNNSTPQTLTAIVEPEDATNKSIEWSSSDASVVSVSQNGTVTVEGEGSATIIATAKDGSGVQATVPVSVGSTPVTGVTVNIDNLSLTPSCAPVALQASVEPANASNKAVTWVSSDESVVKVNSSGVVTVVGLGNATITVTTTDGDFTANVAVEVKAVEITNITLNHTSLELTRISAPTQLVATIEPETAAGTTLTWSSSDESVVKVNANGIVTVVSEGTANVTAQAPGENGFVATCVVTVKPTPVQSVALNRNTLSLVVNGATSTLVATVNPAEATNKAVTWKSSDESVATVIDGVVTPREEGTATITVTSVDDATKTATCEVTVSSNTIPVTGVSITPKSLNLVENETATLEAIITPSNASITSVVWSVADETVASINQAGKVTALAAGTTTISVKTDNGNKEDAITITVSQLLVNSITIPASSTLLVGDSKQLIATVLPAGANSVLQWQSSNEAVATVDATGKVIAVSQGSASITATATDGSGTVSNTSTVIVSDVVVPITSVDFVDAQNIIIETGESVDLSAYLLVNPTDATVQSVSWTSNNPTAAAIDENGVVTAGSVNLTTSVTITVRVKDTGGKEIAKTLNIQVAKAKILVSSIVIPSTLTVQEGAVATLAVTTIAPANADNKSVTWSIVSGSGITIDATSGQITATGALGSVTTVRATANDNGSVESNICEVTVTERIVPVTSVSVDVTSLSITKNESAIVTLTFNPENTTQTDISIEAGSLGVVSVTKLTDNTYQFIGLKGGNQQVILRSAFTSTVFASVSVSVTELVSSISVNSTNGASSAYIGETVQLLATVSESTATNKTITWHSSDATIASVSSSGLVTAHKQGNVYITAKASDGSNVEGVFPLSVQKVEVAGLIVTTVHEIELGTTHQLSYILSPANATVQEVIFESSDESIATVSESGLITPVGLGSVTITVLSVDNPSIVQLIETSIVPKKADMSYLIQLIENEHFGAYSIQERIVSGEIVIGFRPGEVSPLTQNNFTNAWLAAQTVRNNEFSTQEEVDLAATNLAKAIEAMGFVITDVSIESVESVNVTVYPTLVTDYVNVKASVEINTVEILSVSGNVIDVYSVNQPTVQIPVYTLNQGVYFVKITTATGVIVKQIIK